MQDLKSKDLLAETLASFYADPLGFVMFVFPWDTDPSIQLVELEDKWAEKYGSKYGPDAWACLWLEELGAEIKDRGFDGINAVDPIMMATSSGHGIGKSTITAWLILFIMATRPYAKGVVTSNTGEQLKTKTWAELGKWLKKSLVMSMFTYNNGKGNMNMYSVDMPESWRVDAQTCREENSESFAGLHAANSTPFYIFDEASAVPDKIWEVAEGGTTDGEPMWFAWGNPTRNTGRFFECFNRFRHRWIGRLIDSRDVKITNKNRLKGWVDDYSEDSDFVRVRVRGVFPRAGSMQFIDGESVRSCMEAPSITALSSDPIVMGVDVARFGDDQSVIYIRRGRDARDVHLSKYREMDTMQLASRVSELSNEFDVDTVFVDGGGVGGGVVDRLRQLNVRNVVEVQFGGQATHKLKYANMRAQMWGNMREAIKAGIILPDDIDLQTDLTSVEYGYARENLIQLEKKEDMKKRGIASPDVADALALTYAYPVAPRHGIDGLHRPGSTIAHGANDYDPYN